MGFTIKQALFTSLFIVLAITAIVVAINELDASYSGVGNYTSASVVRYRGNLSIIGGNASDPGDTAFDELSNITDDLRVKVEDAKFNAVTIVQFIFTVPFDALKLMFTGVKVFILMVTDIVRIVAPSMANVILGIVGAMILLAFIFVAIRAFMKWRDL